MLAGSFASYWICLQWFRFVLLLLNLEWLLRLTVMVADVLIVVLFCVVQVYLEVKRLLVELKVICVALL